LGESYNGIRTLAEFSAIVTYTNMPSGIVAYLVATLASANKLSSAVTGGINLVVTLVSINSDGGDLLRVGFDAAMADDEAE
jgi:hypothetical protein